MLLYHHVGAHLKTFALARAATLPKLFLNIKYHTCGVLVLRQLSWVPPEEVLQYQPKIFFIITSYRERIKKQV